MRIALFQPDIPQNTGSIIRLSACFGISLDIIEPCGFVFSNTKLRRSSMDYFEYANIERHKSWENFIKCQVNSRLVLITTKATKTIDKFSFHTDDTLLLGQETSGVPEAVHRAIPSKVRVPMLRGRRSLNVAICASIVLWEALKQTNYLTSAD
ncbi:MAG: tRNA methyltransferase [Rhodospirillaceae bacterium]|nr:tRNA methyltransferase [Rhodospirillaceae bacterium]|tara:strand:- start:572 stop:1030 length:459 start_codon:yes stop_codon:yes gene_type:complete